jgi:hypothetical protein
MDIEMLNKFLKVVISAVILSGSGYANIASAFVVDIMPTQEPLLTTYEWSARCFDCNYETRGDTPDSSMWTDVKGSLTLSDYTIGDDITFNNLYSFIYIGPSIHLPNGLSVGKVESPLQYEYSFVNYFMSYGKIFDDGVVDIKFVLGLTPEVYECEEGIDNCIARPGGWRYAEASHQVELKNAMNTKWSIKDMELNDFDFGNGFKICDVDCVEVPAPSTLAIFALGLMGLGLRRIKKQS